MVSHWFSSHYKIICLPYYNFNLSCTQGYGIMFSQYSKPNTRRTNEKMFRNLICISSKFFLKIGSEIGITVEKKQKLLTGRDSELGTGRPNVLDEMMEDEISVYLQRRVVQFRKDSRGVGQRGILILGGKSTS